ncbi:MAG: hypothetical protein DMG05_03765 [Acidobacteria bacterium]|nr:MAG: hypothetical protein DMG05_03765 [Acidobacteriota bacterium]
MKFGLYLEQNWDTDGASASCFSGCFDYNRDVNNPGDTNWAFSNALLGNFRRYRETNARPRYQGKDTIWEWFAQDTWKVNRKLTLTYGMRFAWFTPWYLNKGPGAAFVQDRYDPSQVPPLYRPAIGPNGQRLAQDPTTGQLFPEVYIGAFAAGSYSFPGQVLASDTSYPKGFREQQGIQPTPRFGFAYDLFGNGKTAIRGGFGTMKQLAPTYSAYITNTVDSPPGKYQPQIYYGNMNTFLRQPGLLFPTGTYAYQRNDIVPSIYRFSFGIQHELRFGTVIDASYVGNVARHLIQGYDPNVVPYGAHFQPQNIDPTTGSALPDDFYRPIPGYNSITTVIPSGTSNYHSLQVAINRRFSRGVSFGLSYTWSKTMNTGANDTDGLATYRPWRVWNYGPSSFDQTQMLVVNYVWDLPKLSKFANNAVVRGVFDNWQIAGVTSFSSGLPFPINVDTTDGADIAGGGDGWRAMLIGQPQLSHGERTLDRWFNTAAFGRPPQGYYGDAPVYPVRGPGLNNWDMTIMKQFPLWSEVRRLQFRAEMYNAWNHPNFSHVDNSALFDESGQQVSSTFGQLDGTRSARVIQLSLRFTF